MDPRPATDRRVFRRPRERQVRGSRSRRAVRLALFAVLVCACGGTDDARTTPSASSTVASAVAGRSKSPNIVLVSIDTLNRNALACFEASAPPLPFLDAF